MKIDFIQAIIIGLIPTLVFLTVKSFGGMGFLKPIPSSSDIIPLTEVEYKKISIRYGVIVIASMVILSIIYVFLFFFLSRSYFNLFFSERFYLPMPEIAFAIPAMFLGIVTSAIPVEYFFKKNFLDTYKRYWKACDNKYNFDGRKVNSLIFKIGSLVVALCFLYFLKCTSYVKDRTVSINDFGSFLSRQYSVTDIASIVELSNFKAPNGKVVNRTNYNVTFKDNWIWNIDDADSVRFFLATLSSLSGIVVNKE